jgi:Na+-transporting methylmalonyl-CoA/oxaloacetate decarboxylase beta subunit
LQGCLNIAIASQYSAEIMLKLHTLGLLAFAAAAGATNFTAGILTA